MTAEIYQDFILELYKNPINFGRIDGAELTASGFNPLCGDKIEIFIKLAQDEDRKRRTQCVRVREARFTGTGCAISQATASLLTEEMKGKTISELAKMKKEDIMRIIKIDLSRNPSRLKCALLSLEVLKKAISV